MFGFAESPVAVRSDIPEVCALVWRHFAEPGPVLDAHQRRSVLAAARRSVPGDHLDEAVSASLLKLAHTLYDSPAAVDERLVRTATDQVGDPATVEVIGLVAMLAAVDGTHNALGIELADLPDPQSGAPTGDIAIGMRRRRTHVAMPQGAIPMALGLLPSESALFQSLFGPLYMTGAEMASPTFARRPGLDRAQMELVSSRTSLLNECFY